MASKGIALFGVLVLFASVQLATSIKCYVCNTSDAGCNDPFTNGTKLGYDIYCSEGQDHCLKVVHPEDDDCWRRLCGKEVDCLLYADCYSCTGDLCNLSSSTVPSFLITGIITSLIAKYF